MGDLGPLRERYVQAQIEGDRAQAVAIVREAVKAGHDVHDIHLQLVQAAQYEIGRLWESNAISISTEHQATAISQLAMAALYDQLPRAARNGKRVLLACVEGEQHDMGIRIAADFLEMDGFDVRLLGANVPPDSLTERVTALRPDLVGLSATMAFHLPALERSIAAVRRASPGHVPILIGGRAFTADSEIGKSLDVQGFGSDATAFVAEARRVTVLSAA